MIDNTDLLSHLDGLAQAKVLVVGDVMLDQFIAGSVDRISPEGPIPVLKVAHETTLLGGAGNVFRNLDALGVAAYLAGAVGDDAAGHAVEGLAAMAAQGQSDLTVVAERETTVKERYLASGQQLLRVDRETKSALPAEAEAVLLAAAQKRMAECDAVVLSDYGKGVLTASGLAQLIAAARAEGLPVVVDPKGRDYSLYRGASVITPNRRELSEASGLAVDSDDTVIAAARRLIESCGIEAVLATRSEDGMTLVAGAADPVHYRVEAQEVFDVSGAGDTVVAVLAAALALDMALADAVRLANLAAGIVVSKVGTAVVHAEDLRRQLYVTDVAGSRGQGHRARATARTGCPLAPRRAHHRLHQRLLRSLAPRPHLAAETGSRGLRPLDRRAQQRRLGQAPQGDSRPIQGEAARSTVLASVASVDQVVVFGEDTPLRLIEALKPDVLVKGADYSREQVVGGDIVEGYGGRIVLADLLDGHSTTRTIEKL